MNRIMIIILGVFSCLYFELSFLVIHQQWIRIIVYLAIFMILSFSLKYIFDKKLALIRDFTTEIAKGNYSYNLETNKTGGILQQIIQAVSELKNKLLKYIFEMQVAASQVSAVSQELALTLDENNAFSQQLYAEADEIRNVTTNSFGEVNNAVNEIQDIVALLENINGISDEMKVINEQSKQNVDDSLKEILDVVDAINDIQESTNETVEYMNRLGAAVEQVTYILQTVENIAKQTHMLSLNASIESARAGEYGKGFTVVAEEIRKLSEGSKSSVDEISNLVGSISLEMDHLKNRVNNDLVNVNKSVACSKNVENSLNRIQMSFDKMQDMMHNIIKVSQEEYALAGNINDKVTLINGVLTNVASGIDVVYDSINEQKKHLGEIESLGSRLTGSSQNLEMLSDKRNISLLKNNLERFNEMVDDTVVLVKEQLLENHNIYDMDPESHQVLLDDFLQQHGYIEAIWTNNVKGKFIYSNPPAGIANAKVRDWFKESIEGQLFVSDVYISSITKHPCITISLPIEDQSEQCIGVLGVDLKLHI